MAFNPENWKRVMGSTENIHRYSEKIVMKDEYGDTLSFEVDEGDDSDYDNSLYMVVHEGDSNNVIEWRFTREELHQLIQYLVDVTKPDDREVDDTFEVPTNDDVIEHVDEYAEKLDRVEDTLIKLENRLAKLLANDNQGAPSNVVEDLVDRFMSPNLDKQVKDIPREEFFAWFDAAYFAGRDSK